MKIIKVENIDDKFVAYYLQKFNVPFEHLELKKLRGRENYELIGEIKDQIGKCSYPFELFGVKGEILLDKATGASG